MGGHQYGEVASNAAVRIIAGQVLRKFHSYLFSLPTQPPEESLQEIMDEAIRDAHRVVQRDAPGSGTTVTAALVLGEQVTVGHVGDSRMYSIHPSGAIEQLTHDHSLVRRLEELGHLNRRGRLPRTAMCSSALGQGDTIDADIFTIPFPQGATSCCVRMV
jgi:protein phosphatase